MKEIIIIAHTFFKKNKIKEVKEELLKLVNKTLKERGCITYILHQDLKDPSHFMIYEKWESYELWQNHLKADAITQFRDSVKGAVKSSAIYEMSHTV